MVETELTNQATNDWRDSLVHAVWIVPALMLTAMMFPEQAMKVFAQSQALAHSVAKYLFVDY